MKYKAAIFDLDGTILDTIEDMADSMNYCLISNGFPGRTADEIRSFVGNGIHKLVERALPTGTSSDTIEELYEQYLSYYSKHCAVKTRPYDGIADLISILRSAGIRTAVVSNKADNAVKELCDKYFPNMFDFTLGDKTGKRRKPFPDGIFRALDALETSIEESVYIGDSEVDVQTAQNASMDMLIVSWGFRKAEFLMSCGATNIVDSPDELMRKILQ